MADSKAHDAIAPAGDNLDRYPSADGPESDDAMQKIIQKARAATEKERKMGIWKGMKIYPKAVAWSILISTCIAMEGYDISLVNNFYAFPQFNRKYGELQGDGSYEVPARVGYTIVLLFLFGIQPVCYVEDVARDGPTTGTVIMMNFDTNGDLYYSGNPD